jgi:hypothetical protein
MHAVSTFMQIQKLWQIVRVSIACVQTLDDILVPQHTRKKFDDTSHTEHKLLYKLS